MKAEFDEDGELVITDMTAMDAFNIEQWQELNGRPLIVIHAKRKKREVEDE